MSTPTESGRNGFKANLEASRAELEVATANSPGSQDAGSSGPPMLGRDRKEKEDAV